MSIFEGKTVELNIFKLFEQKYDSLDLISLRILVLCSLGATIIILWLFSEDSIEADIITLIKKTSPISNFLCTIFLVILKYLEDWSESYGSGGFLQVRDRP